MQVQLAVELGRQRQPMAEVEAEVVGFGGSATDRFVGMSPGPIWITA